MYNYFTSLPFSGQDGTPQLDGCMNGPYLTHVAKALPLGPQLANPTAVAYQSNALHQTKQRPQLCEQQVRTSSFPSRLFGFCSCVKTPFVSIRFQPHEHLHIRLPHLESCFLLVCIIYIAQNPSLSISSHPHSTKYPLPGPCKNVLHHSSFLVLHLLFIRLRFGMIQVASSRWSSILA